VSTREEGEREGGPVRAAPHGGRVGGLTSDSCAGATEAGVGRAVFGEVWK
jgi:hypothetical protein